jgi:small-conductance mechanosensitive channel
MTDEFFRVGSAGYWAMLGLLLGTRGADFLSTWVATPRLLLEGNPLAKRLGWKWGGAVNLAVCLAFAAWPLSAVVIATTSALVAARNFQSAWLMRLLGEDRYRAWYVQHLQAVPLPLYVFCLAGQTFLICATGAALMLFSGERLVPFAIGLGIVGYAVAVAFYTSLALWRIRRSPR